MPTTQLPLDDLIAKAAAGDPWSLETLLLHYHDPLLRFISSRIIRTPAHLITPEDILQETMMGAFRSIKTLTTRGHAAFFTWLKTIARTRFLNLLEAHNAKKRGGDHHPLHNHAHDDPTAISLLARIAGHDPTPSWIARRKETLHAIADALASLDDQHKQIIDLRYRHSLPLEEIAQRLGKSEGAIKMALNRIITLLRNRLAENSGEFSAGA
jgi:RNA polymerase sigma-70 factor (ECF subfamily)